MYMSSSLNTSSSRYDYGLAFDYSEVGSYSASGNRYIGYSVRPVLAK
jgi:hypothetical protein